MEKKHQCFFLLLNLFSFLFSHIICIHFFLFFCYFFVISSQFFIPFHRLSYVILWRNLLSNLLANQSNVHFFTHLKFFFFFAISSRSEEISEEIELNRIPVAISTWNGFFHKTFPFIHSFHFSFGPFQNGKFLYYFCFILYSFLFFFFCCHVFLLPVLFWVEIQFFFKEFSGARIFERKEIWLESWQKKRKTIWKPGKNPYSFEEKKKTFSSFS